MLLTPQAKPRRGKTGRDKLESSFWAGLIYLTPPLNPFSCLMFCNVSQIAIFLRFMVRRFSKKTKANLESYHESISKFIYDQIYFQLAKHPTVSHN